MLTGTLLGRQLLRCRSTAYYTLPVAFLSDSVGQSTVYARLLATRSVPSVTVLSHWLSVRSKESLSSKSCGILGGVTRHESVSLDYHVMYIGNHNIRGCLLPVACTITSDLQVKSCFPLSITSSIVGVATRSQITTPTEYRLPTIWHQILDKKTILDPATSRQFYELPSFVDRSRGVVEKLTPSTQHAPVTIEEPHPLQENGIPASSIRKETMPYLISIRHRKMKKHKLRKLRKRRKFVIRNLLVKRAKLKEKKIVEFETSMRMSGEQFDANKYIDEHLKLARDAGWGIDILRERANRKVVVGQEPSK